MKEEKTERRSITRKVAFTAMFSSAPIQLTAGRSLLFDRVDYNEGNAYDTTSGIMTCPITGTYLFYTNVLSQPNALDVATEIVRERNGKGRTYAYGGSHNAQGGISAILHCRTGERVWVRTNYGFQIFGADHSSFSGFILWSNVENSSDKATGYGAMK
ncbi:hypothetical protein CHS0354_001477 [Potamilus streckersoni]|uniref:C1q domain-containing protein n=1 Tax=Potamilus streckersoni TaxID=2493646 RepID=A0AAE0W804_9BIVA|nr:hypothetical protein CHS0354_001477 [Potamilus streckersoni]